MTHSAVLASPLPLLPLRHGVVLPGRVTTIPIGRARTFALAQSLRLGDIIGIATQRDATIEDPALVDLHPIGVLARVKERVDRGSRGMMLVVEGLERFELKSLVQTTPHWTVRGEPVVESVADSAEAEALVASLRQLLGELAGRDRAFLQSLSEAHDPGLVADRIAGWLETEPGKKVEVLLALEAVARLRHVAELVAEARTRAELRERIEGEVRREVSRSQKEMMLRQQLRAIQKELGNDEDDPTAALRKKLDDAALPEEIRTIADRELGRLEAMGPNQPEANVIRNYLEWIADLPWSKRAEANVDVDAIARALDDDHYGLDEVKRRVLEHMAVLKLLGKSKGTILCLVGPPGVGKTSLAQSVARATGRPLARVSLGGVRDEAEVRGHRRTYIGALPGRIIGALRKAKVKNPVLVLDEIDKLGRGFQGDPEAALLEVLDPEQNHAFTDHYLDAPFDLSEVLFIATANDLSSVAPPLRDRMEVIEISGYTSEEKVHIARGHLLPKALETHGLAPEAIELDDATIELAVREYTREAGVRQLSRELAKVCRAVALDVARTKDAPSTRVLVADAMRKILGRPRFHGVTAEPDRAPGVAAGLAWTPVGGDILYIETTRMSGKGRVEITGQLGDVMKESARAALAFLRSRADRYGVDPDFLETSDLHVHVPAGAVPKDGPSAGVTLFTAFASLLTGRRVRGDTAMTGEATLRGRVLPVGGIKSKVLAAHRAGFTRVILPKENERDLDDVPETVRNELSFVLVDDMSDVFEAALETERAAPQGVANREAAPAAGGSAALSGPA